MKSGIAACVIFKIVNPSAGQINSDGMPDTARGLNMPVLKKEGRRRRLDSSWPESYVMEILFKKCFCNTRPTLRYINAFSKKYFIKAEYGNAKGII